VSAGQVLVTDVELSDHHLLAWFVPTMRATFSTEKVTRRPWRKLDVETLGYVRQSLVRRLCQHELWPADTDAPAEIFDSQMNDILDKLRTSQQVLRRQRSSDDSFDTDCRDAKRLTRRLERVYSAAVRRIPQQLQDTQVDDAKTAWYAQRQRYRDLRQHKRRDYWVELVETNRDSPKRLWRTDDQLLGRGRLPVNSAVTAEDLSYYFEKKVAVVQASQLAEAGS